MKKDRNSFFQSSNFNMSASGPMPMYEQNPMYMNNTPNINAAASNYYQANNIPIIPMNMNSSFNSNELDAKLAKIERAINRLEARINKLEGSTYYSKDTYESDGNMYIV